jgi:DNA-binding transcriptional MerR regulator
VAAVGEKGLRIGDLARAAGTTPRTVRYYEELGLLKPSAERAAGAHRTYTEDDVERLRHIIRLKGLLGVSLEELGELLEAEEASAARRAEYRAGATPARKRAILEEALGYIDRQLALVDRRAAELDGLRRELDERRARVRDLLEDPADA